MPTSAVREAAVEGREADLWYCPVCGYIDPKTPDVYCPKTHADWLAPVMFRQAVYGYYLRVGIEEGTPKKERASRA